MLRSLIRLVFDTILPRDSGEEMLEQLSFADFLSRVAKNGEKLPEGIEAILSYKDPLVKNMIWLLKYKKNERAAEFSAQVFLEKVLEDMSDKKLWRGGKKAIFVPIPISEKRMRERGYNQTEFLAEKIMNLGGHDLFILDAKILARVRDTMPQTKLPREKRLVNLRGAFEVTDATRIAEKHVVLLDDVTTTGATFTEAKETLRRAGAQSVECFAIAH